MKQDTKEMIWKTMQAVGIFGMAISLWAASVEVDNLRSEAVERGYAEWKVTPSGKTSWYWKESK